MISFKEITRKNLGSILKLSVFDEQKDQVASNGDSISIGFFNPEYSWLRAIYNDDEPVGFLGLYLNEEKGKYQIWRLMIDKNHQGKGYGRISVNLIKEVIKEMIPKVTEIQLSYVPKGNRGADKFYKKLGFEDTGEMWGKEKVMSFKY